MAVLGFLHSSSNVNGDSMKAMESLADLRWTPRLAEEKSRNSSIQLHCGCDGGWTAAEVVVVGMKLAVVGSLW